MKYFAAQLIYKITSALRDPQPYVIEMRMVRASEQQAALREAHRIGETSMKLIKNGANRIFLGIKSLEEVPLETGKSFSGETQEFLLADTLA